MIKFFRKYYTKWTKDKHKYNPNKKILITFEYDTEKEKINCTINAPKINSDIDNVVYDCEKIGFFISNVTYKNNMLKNLVHESIQTLKKDERTTLYYDNILFFWGQYDHIQYDKINEPVILPTKVFKMYAESNNLL